MKYSSTLLCAVVVLMLFSSTCLGVTAATAVDTELCLLVDVSASLDANEYELQLQGYANAFRNPNLLPAVQSGQHGKIGVAMIMWAGEDQQRTVVDWKIVSDQTSATALGDEIENLIGVSRPFDGSTKMGAAIEFGAGSFDNDLDGDRQIIDVSGDGIDGDNTATATATAAARDAALEGGVDVINGLAVNNTAGVTEWFQANVIGGDGGEVWGIGDYNEFESAVLDKLSAEIPVPAAIPEPVTMACLGLSVMGLVGYVRRRKMRDA